MDVLASRNGSVALFRSTLNANSTAVIAQIVIMPATIFAFRDRSSRATTHNSTRNATRPARDCVINRQVKNTTHATVAANLISRGPLPNGRANAKGNTMIRNVVSQTSDVKKDLTA